MQAPPHRRLQALVSRPAAAAARRAIVTAARDRLRAALAPLGDGDQFVNAEQIAELAEAARELLDEHSTTALLSVLCGLCMHARLTANAAVTIIGGVAVCDEHTGYVQGGDFSRALALVIDQEGGRPAT
jgi:hypothetical protein